MAFFRETWESSMIKKITMLPTLNPVVINPVVINVFKYLINYSYVPPTTLRLYLLGSERESFFTKLIQNVVTFCTTNK